MFSKGLKQPKEYFTIKKKTVSINGCYAAVCLKLITIVLMKMMVYTSSCRPELDCWKCWWQEGDTGGWGAESEKAERTSVQGVGVTASRPLDLLDVLQDHVV